MTRFAISIMLVVVAGLFFAQNVLAFDDPFVPYLASIPPVNQTISDTNSGTGASAITTKEITFSSRGGVNTVYAIIAYPQQAGKYPGLLALHGGGSDGVQLKALVQGYARRGYVAISPDLPGICGTTNTPYSSGPWKTKPSDEGPRFDVASGPQNSTLVDAEVAGLEAFNYLRSQADVDTGNMGITGFSWGGYSTTMLSGMLDNKVKASYAVFGCGFYDKGTFWTAILDTMSDVTRNTWITFLDAGRRESNMKAAYFIEGETNDHFFWPSSVTATLQAVPGVKNQARGPNLNHTQLPAGGTMQQMYFDYYLKKAGSGFATDSISGVVTQTDGSKKIFIGVAVPAGVSLDSVKLYYSIPDTIWEFRTWQPVNAALESGTTYSAVLSSDLVKKNVDYYAFVTDTRNFSTSSYIYSVSAATEIAVNSIPQNKNRFEVVADRAHETIAVEYRLFSATSVSILVFDMRGACVKSIPNDFERAGSNSQVVDIRDVRPGIYVVKLLAQGIMLSRHISIVR